MTSLKQMSIRQRMQEAARSYANGGPIRGPGTGTSDSIPDKMRPGTFIMPADSTQSLGAKALSSLGKKVPVKVSNGEYEYTPEQVHAVGLRALSQLKDATHTPAQGADPAQHLAFGGEVTNDVTRIGNSYSGGNVGGSITVNGQQPSGAFSFASPVPTPAPPRPAPVAPVVQAVQYMQPSTATPASPALSAMATPPATPPAVAKPVDSFTARNNAVSASSITNNGGRFDRNGQQFANGGDVRGFKPEPQRLAQGDKVLTEEEKKQRAQISTRNIYPQGSPSAGRSPYVSAPASPLAPAAPTDSKMWQTKAVVQGAADDAKAAWDGGNTAQAVGAATRGLLTAGPTMVGEAAYNLAAPVFGAARGFLGGLTGEPPTTQAPASAATQTAPVVPVTATQTDVQRGGGNVAAVAEPDAPPAAQPAPAQPAAQAMAQVPSLAPVQAQGFQAPTVRHSGNDWQARNDLRNARVSASSIMNRPEWHGSGMGRFRGGQQQGPSASTMAYQAALAQDAAARGQEIAGNQQAMVQGQSNVRAAMQQTGENQRTSLREQGFATRDQRKAGMDERTLAMHEAESGFKTRAQAQLENLRGTLLDPNATTEQKAQAQAQISALNGGQNGEWGVQVTPATKNVDGSTTAGSIVKYNKRTGETATVDGTGQGAAAVAPLPPKDKLIKGNVYQTQSGSYRWNGSTFDKA